jgi:hypothetical protein
LIPQPGSIVRVRSRQYLVEGVELPPTPRDSTLVRLSCLEDDAQGDALEVLWEREIDARPHDDTAWDRIASRGFDAPRSFSAYLHTLRWNCVTATDPRLFQTPRGRGREGQCEGGREGEGEAGTSRSRRGARTGRVVRTRRAGGGVMARANRMNPPAGAPR